ncbi:EscU/YscU/HrcU family type III secretion system export apparatus switch protein [Variovorax sp. OV329]|uniref:EscU/YscU/HrcU family type III secretion system export apparatus switch protein n=1 Tax=Variovorax sp. OV329 TaxID=1882825 RepID=UPI0008EA8E07|nr:EscU/YscU/HrcU family type III secretion system export apparatus switch protein [Variovorax sp. OV329]SFM65364.1 flagellar biosynthesis protein [Variovorax sp. OV329]
MNGEAINQRLSAVALSHRDPDRAPMVVAKGYGAVAEQIMRAAREHGLYVHASPGLNQLLMQVKLDAQVPPALYEAVAEVLAWLWRIEEGGTPEIASRMD